MGRPLVLRMVYRAGTGGSALPCLCKDDVFSTVTTSGTNPPNVTASGTVISDGNDIITLPSVNDFNITFSPGSNKDIVVYGIYNSPTFAQSSRVAAGYLDTAAINVNVGSGTFYVEFIAVSAFNLNTAPSQGPFSHVPGAPVITLTGPVGISVDNYTITVPEQKTYTQSPNTTIVNGTGTYDGTRHFWGLYYSPGVPVVEFQDTNMPWNSDTTADIFLPNLSQQQYYVGFYARHIVQPGGGDPDYFGDPSNIVYSDPFDIAELPEALTHGGSVTPATFALCPQFEGTEEGKCTVPSTALVNWSTYFDSISGVITLPQTPVGPGGPYDRLETTVGFYTDPARTVLDPGAHPGATLIDYSETVSQDITVTAAGTYYVRMTSKLTNNQSGGAGSLFDAEGPARVDDFDMFFQPIIGAPTILTVPSSIFDGTNLTLFDLSDGAQYTWTDTTIGTFTDNQEQLGVLAYKVDNGVTPVLPGTPADNFVGAYVYGTGPATETLATATANVQGHYRFGFQILHRNTTTNPPTTYLGLNSDTVLHPTQVTFWLDPAISALAVPSAVDVGDVGIDLPLVTDFTIVDNNFSDPAGYPKSTSVRYEIHDNAGYTNQVASGNLSGIVNVPLSDGTYYMRYQCRYVLGDGSGTVTPWSAYFNEAGSLTVQGQNPGSGSANVTAVVDSDTQITVSWSGFADTVGVTAYDVYRNTVNTQPGAPTYANETGSSKVDTGLTPGVTYYYWVVGKDGAGNESAAIASGPASTLDSIAPTAGTASAVVDSGTQVTVSWSGFTDNVGVTAYDVYRNTVNTQPGAPTYANETGSSKVDTGLTPATTYYYWVVGKDAAGNASTAAASNAATTLDTVAPTGGSASAVADSTTQVTVSWSGFTDNVGVTAYDVYRNTVNTQPGSAAYTNVGASPQVDTGLTPDTTYYYWVVGKDAAGNQSTAAATGAVTTPANDLSVGKDTGPGEAEMPLFDTPGTYTNDLAGVGAYLTAESGGHVYGTTPGNITFNTAEELFELSGGNVQIYGDDTTQTLPFTASIDFVLPSGFTAFSAHVGCMGTTTADTSAEIPTTTYNSFTANGQNVNYIDINNINSQVLVKSGNVNVFSGTPAGMAGLSASLVANTRYRMEATIVSATEVQILVKDAATDTVLGSGTYVNNTVSPAYNASLYWCAYFDMSTATTIKYGNMRTTATAGGTPSNPDLSSLAALQASGWTSVGPNTFDGTLKPSGYAGGDTSSGYIQLSPVDGVVTTVNFDITLGTTSGGPRRFFRIFGNGGNTIAGLYIGRVEGGFGNGPGTIYYDNGGGGGFEENSAAALMSSYSTTYSIQITISGGGTSIETTVNGSAVTAAPIDGTVAPFGMVAPFTIQIADNLPAYYSNVVVAV